jgi:hypothetical protein
MQTRLSVRDFRDSLPLEYGTQPNTAFFVHVKDEHRGAARGSKPNNHNIGQAELLFPGVLTWVEKSGNFTRFGINAREIGTLMRVASVAGQGQIRGLIIAAVLARNNVLNVEGRKRELLLAEQTIFAAIACSAKDKYADRRVHQLCRRLERRTRTLACKIPIRSIASM